MIATTASAVQAQSRRPPGTASLAEMGCIKTSGARGYDPIDRDITVGREIFRAVASMGGTNGLFDSYSGIAPREATTSTCRLAEPREIPRFRTLTLSFGLPDNFTINADGATNVRLSIYLDGEFYDSQDVTQGRQLRWPIDVTGVRSIALEAECIRSASDERYCPALTFFEDILEE